jgi:WD40 repeat protein
MDFKMEQQHKYAPESLPVMNLEGHKNAVQCIEYQPQTSSTLFSGSFDHTFASWDLNTGKCLKQILAHQ